MSYSTAEQETIGLCICLEAAGDMANHELLELRQVAKYPGEAEVYFHSHVHEQLFLIRLLDFVKEAGDSQLTGVSGSCLEVLKTVCRTRSFDFDNSVDELRKAVEQLDKWLNCKSKVKLWLPTLDIKAEIGVMRLDFLFMSANHSKHNLFRLTGISRNISKILENNGYAVSSEHVPLALDDFQEHLQENYSIYYGTWLVELINNIIWALHAYLEPQFHRSYVPTADLSYRYEFPKEVQNDVARQWFWRLMNNVRRKPYLKKFSGAHYLKKRCSLEWHE